MDLGIRTNLKMVLHLGYLVTTEKSLIKAQTTGASECFFAR
jgi:hypothetical protein